MPHILKLIRHWLIDTGFILQDGSIVNKNPLAALLDFTDTEVSVCHKLKKDHLECQRSQRQNVALAAQLLSHTSATALLHYKPGDDKVLAENAGKFIEAVSN